MRQKTTKSSLTISSIFTENYDVFNHKPNVINYGESNIKGRKTTLSHLSILLKWKLLISYEVKDVKQIEFSSHRIRTTREIKTVLILRKISYIRIFHTESKQYRKQQIIFASLKRKVNLWSLILNIIILPVVINTS